MLLPCDEVHWMWGPAATGALSRSLASEGWSGSRVAKALALTPAAVSYYLKYKRGTKPLPPSAMNACMKLSGKMLAGKVKLGHLQFEMAKIAVLARHEGQPGMQHQMLSVCRSCLSPKIAKKHAQAAH